MIWLPRNPEMKGPFFNSMFLHTRRETRDSNGDSNRRSFAPKLCFWLILLLSLGWASNTQCQTVISSPDRAVEVSIFPQDESLKYTVSFRKKAVIETSSFSFVVDNAPLAEGAAIDKVEPYQIDETYPWRGGHSKAVNRCAGAKLFLKSSKNNPDCILEVRAFNDGAAFRFILPSDQKRVPDEATSFKLPARSVVWYHDLNGHYEAVHQKNHIVDVKAGEWAAPPLTFQLPDKNGFAAITEAALVNYSGMALQADGHAGFNLVLGHKHPPSHPFRLRYSNDVDRLSQPASVVGTITTPWRVVMVGADLNALVNSDIVHNLCPAPDPKLFPQGMKTDWIKPGRAVWKYLDGGPNTFEGMKEFSRLAGKLGFEYHVIEGFWSRWSNDQLKELVDYSREKGVGIWLWRHSKELRTPEAREAFFRRLHDSGVVGAKIDFFDHEHKEIIDLYTALLQKAAEYHIMVNFHGANKPTGESRTWPNELLREGVRGMESSRLQARARHNTTLPFTRYLAGHGDYTPVHFGARRGDTTWAHQIATAAIFDEPLLTYGAHPTNLLNNPALEMIRTIPPAWDETIVLPQSEIGELAAFARRQGQVWFLAILNGPSATTINVPLSFLSHGPYESLMVRDRAGNPASVAIEKTNVQATVSLPIQLDAGGGFIGRFSPKGG